MTSTKNNTISDRLPKPTAWKAGPNERLHVMHHHWHRSRAQALFRNEPWDLPFAVWAEIWGTDFELRGRDRSGLCMTRCDFSRPWHADNVVIITRGQHARRQFNLRKGLPINTGVDL